MQSARKSGSLKIAGAFTTPSCVGVSTYVYNASSAPLPKVAIAAICTEAL